METLFTLPPQVFRSGLILPQLAQICTRFHLLNRRLGLIRLSHLLNDLNAAGGALLFGGLQDRPRHLELIKVMKTYRVAGPLTTLSCVVL